TGECELGQHRVRTRIDQRERTIRTGYRAKRADFRFALPLNDVLYRFPGKTGRVHASRVVEVEVVRDIHQRLLIEGVQITIRREGSDVDHAEVGRVVVIGAEAIQSDWTIGGWGFQEPDLLEQLDHFDVVFARFTRKPEQKIPVERDVVFHAPLH